MNQLTNYVGDAFVIKTNQAAARNLSQSLVGNEFLSTIRNSTHAKSILRDPICPFGSKIPDENYSVHFPEPVEGGQRFHL